MLGAKSIIGYLFDPPCQVLHCTTSGLVNVAMSFGLPTAPVNCLTTDRSCGILVILP